jgi:transcriptional regulator with XRE-family HTH domain
MTAAVPPEGKARDSTWMRVGSTLLACSLSLASELASPEDGHMIRSSAPGVRKRSTARARHELWARVGAFVRARREELGLSQGEIIRILLYRSRNAVSNIELGIEGVPAKRAYAWADLLEVPRDAFFRFITGESQEVPLPKRAAQREASEHLSTAEVELLSAYRSLPPSYQRRLREQAQAYQLLAHAKRVAKSR